jgi:hypothetical protein
MQKAVITFIFLFSSCLATAQSTHFAKSLIAATEANSIVVTTLIPNELAEIHLGSMKNWREQSESVLEHCKTRECIGNTFLRVSGEAFRTIEALDLPWRETEDLINSNKLDIINRVNQNIQFGTLPRGVSEYVKKCREHLGSNEPEPLDIRECVTTLIDRDFKKEIKQYFSN